MQGSLRYSEEIGFLESLFARAQSDPQLLIGGSRSSGALLDVIERLLDVALQNNQTDRVTKLLSYQEQLLSATNALTFAGYPVESRFLPTPLQPALPQPILPIAAPPVRSDQLTAAQLLNHWESAGRLERYLQSRQLSSSTQSQSSGFASSSSQSSSSISQSSISQSSISQSSSSSINQTSSSSIRQSTEIQSTDKQSLTFLSPTTVSSSECLGFDPFEVRAVRPVEQFTPVIPSFLLSSPARSATQSCRHCPMLNDADAADCALCGSALVAERAPACSSTATTWECPICFESYPVPCDRAYSLAACADNHVYCLSCLSDHFASIVRNALEQPLSCPHPRCSAQASPDELEILLSPELYDRYVTSLVLFSLAQDVSVVWCPYARCGAPIEIVEQCSFGLARVLRCPSCDGPLCSQCWDCIHPGVFCDGVENPIRAWLSQKGSLVKFCYQCRTAVEKNLGCNHITCRCSAQWCWVCEEPYQPGHFTSGPCEGAQFLDANSRAELAALREGSTPPSLTEDRETLLRLARQMRRSAAPSRRVGRAIFWNQHDLDEFRL